MHICLSGKAQSIALKTPPTSIVIDGDKKEWGDNFIYNEEKHIYYNIANDKENLYLVIKTNDDLQLNNILLSGVTFSIDPKGRKKRTYSVTFPVQDMSITKNTTFKTLEEKRKAAKYTRLQKIEVKGFKDIDEDELYIGNTYKIQTALNFDNDGFLVYEEAIPLSLFHAEELVNDEWAYNIKLNAVTAILQPNGQTSVGNVAVSSTIVAVPAGSAPPSKITRDRSSSDASSLSVSPRNVEIIKAVDFWGKFTLAKLQ
jgi:hypothetical protein